MKDLHPYIRIAVVFAVILIVANDLAYMRWKRHQPGHYWSGVYGKNWPTDRDWLETHPEYYKPNNRPLRWRNAPR